ncbi:hypothetical protein M011DRAFT_402536 [Sporormia fimetaria CBS 119925]|uniref:Uncharacterized protein n=1 Tax=Sporormia fimetaria CBS 119925 TaxID=1340428 RepID=A0A6A6VD13_9PLEO|nr:hypothetical protein M011DRAFT_402536 [Sporormia fimetaria CBS 119925]
MSRVGPSNPGMDPNQIVQMALSLSESRRRNVSAGQLIAPQPTSSPRVPSVSLQHNRSAREPGGSLRQYLNEQRRASRNISPYGKTTAGRDPSSATLARAAKAKAAIEIRMEYLRLLENLPPLKPDVFAPGNFTTASYNVPGSPYPHMTRTLSYAGKKHELGRAYNPLQYLRNRRTRARERQSLDHMPEDFKDPDKVRDWVDRIEEESRSPDFRRNDGVYLPEFHEDHDRDAVPSRPTRHRMGWNFTTEELISDVVWLEQDGNKHLIEDRHGHKIFPKLSEQPQKDDFLQPRASKEYTDKRRRSWVESLPGVSADATTGDESDPTSERGRKRRLLPAFRPESPKLKPQMHRFRRRAKRRGSHSDTSSDDESDSQPAKLQGVPSAADTAVNTGPLSLHLHGLLEREAKEAQKKSPEVTSPDTPDKWGVGYRDASRNRFERSPMGRGWQSEDNSESGLRLREPPSIARTLSPGSERDPRLSLDYYETASTPDTPFHPRSQSHVESDVTPPPSRGLDRKSKKSKLDLFRSDDSAGISRQNSLKHRRSESCDKNGKRRGTDEASDGVKLGHAVKTLLSHKKTDSVNSLTNTDSRRDYKEFKDSPSAVTRFFKGVKNEGSKVGEFIFKKDRPAEDTGSDSDSVFDEGDDITKQDSGIGRSGTVTSTISFDSKQRGRYHVELPSFRSSNDPSRSREGEPLEDHVTRQARARANSRSARFDRLAPPRMDLGSMSAKSSPAHSRSPSIEPPTQRQADLDDENADRFPTLTPFDTRTSHTSSQLDEPSHPRFERRHWSITDDDPNNPRRTKTTHTITRSDIARARALFLCSGIKAHEISRRAHETRTPPPPFLLSAASLTNSNLMPVPTKEEHVLAARILVRNLEASTLALQHSAQRYREHTIKDLNAMISRLKSRVESELEPKVHGVGDEALRIVRIVSAEAPLGVKQVSDRMENMIRARRGRMRWVRRVGWMVVEWMVLGVMWWVWLVVMVVGVVKRGVGGLLGVVRWLLWV